MTAGQVEVIGGKKNVWLHSDSDGFDLTHPPTPSSSPIHPRRPLETTKARVAIDPAKTALIVVDLQNYFLAPSLGRPADAVGMKAVNNLLECAIPACRKAKIQIVWLSWGLTDQDIEEMPPTIVKGFAADNNFDGDRRINGLGSEVGSVQLEDGSNIDARPVELGILYALGGEKKVRRCLGSQNPLVGILGRNQNRGHSYISRDQDSALRWREH